MEPDQQFEIQLSHVCNNRCVFCISGQMTELRRARPTPVARLCAELDKARGRGITKITLLGGEPTLHVSFFPVLRHAVEVGFEDIVIFTNGVRLWNRAFIERVLELDARFSWRLSIQGWNAEDHDATVKKRGAFRKLVQGMEHLSALDQPIQCNMCVVEQNYRSLRDLPSLVERFPIRQVHLDMVRPRDSGERSEDYLDGILPDYTELAAVLGEMLAEVERLRPDLDINIGNLPFCLLPEWAHRIHHGGEMTYTVAAEGDGSISEAWDKYEDKRTDKLKTQHCASCLFEPRCDGFFELYARRRGTAEFRPISTDQLRERDPGQRTFLHQVGPAVAALRAHPAGPWRLAAVDDDEIARWIRLHHAHSEGGVATLLLLPAAAPGGGDGEHRDFTLRLERIDGMAPGSAVDLLAGVFDRLVAVLGPSVRARPTAERLRDRRRALGRGSPVPPGVQRRVQRLVRARGAAGWALHGAEPLLEPLGARLLFSGPSGDAAVLRLVHSLQDGRPRVGVIWDFESEGPEGPRRELLRAVADLLRNPGASAPPKPRRLDTLGLKPEN